MEVQRALDLLKGYLKEIPILKKLHPDNEQWSLWRNKVNVVLKAAFGNDSDEYMTLNPRVYGGMKDEQRGYLRDLEYAERGIKEILQKYDILGIPSEVRSPAEKKAELPKAFIAHGGESHALTKLKEYLVDLGVKPLIVEKEASESRSVNEQVEHNLAQADCAIVLGTADDKNLADGRLYPRDNVEIEIGRFQERFPRRTIYLLEKGAFSPSNISEKVYERFTQDNMEKAFAKVARELRAFGILKSVKPTEKKVNA